MIAGAAAILAGLWAERAGLHSVLAAGSAWLMLASPMTAMACGVVAIAAVRWRRAAAVTRVERAADGDLVLLADLLAVGVASGRTVRGSFEAAVAHVHPGVGHDVDLLLAEMDHSGTSVALAAASGRLAPVCRVAASAALSGAPVASALAAHAEQERHTRHSARVAAARRLPVRLLLPLALLILPGFVVLAVGPALIHSLARLTLP
ncbi:MAG: type II secretion system F family protein [Acidimicrobiia bacterium]|nr:MAG: type II secretion system F family protein [Acidimicrobiia bacterium]